MKPLAALAALLLTGTLPAQTPVPILLNYQGRVVVGTTNFDGSGQFRFALVDPTGNTTTYWSNDGTSVAGSQPTAFVTLPVAKGLCSIMLGNTDPAKGPVTTAIPASVFTNPDVRLAVWFDDGTNGPQRLTPDQRIAPSGYLADGSVTSAKIAANAVGSTHIASGAVGSTQLAAGAVQIGNIAIGAVGSAQIAPGAIGSNQFDATVGLWTASGGNIFRNGGNVGIGTASPAVKFHVFGNSGSVVQYIGSGEDTFGRMKLEYNATSSLITSYANSTIGYKPLQLEGSKIVLGSDSGGNVGIGTTGPSERLTLAGGNFRIDHIRPMIVMNQTGGPQWWNMEVTQEANTTGDFALREDNVGGSLRMIVQKNTGNVGIGITSPQNKLQVGSGWVEIDNGYGVGSTFRTVGGWYRPNFGLAIPHTSEYGSLNFLDHPSGFEPTFAFRSSLDNSAWMVLSRGNVGIGTTT